MRLLPDRTGDGVTVRTGCDQRGAWDAEDLARQQVKIVAAINALDADVVGLWRSRTRPPSASRPTKLCDARGGAQCGCGRGARGPMSRPRPRTCRICASRTSSRTRSSISRRRDTRWARRTALGDQSADDRGVRQRARADRVRPSRPPAGGEDFLFVVNHFKSKGSAGPWPGRRRPGDGQGESNESRSRQATALARLDRRRSDGAGTSVPSSSSATSTRTARRTRCRCSTTRATSMPSRHSHRRELVLVRRALRLARPRAG